jgi:imidazoleglycerol-phosphate dehydratase
MSRTARIERVTEESKVLVELDLDGSGRARVATGVPFYDHMLTSLARHSLIDLTVQAAGDVEVDAHHTVEDVAITLGEALREALGDKVGIRRFGDSLVPLDEALVQCAVDLSGRPYCVHIGEPDGQAFVAIGTPPHHVVEAQFKALARALRDAVALDPRETSVPSTKGSL